MKVVRRDATAFWAFVERISKRQERWPVWKQRAADAEFITPPQRAESEVRS